MRITFNWSVKPGSIWAALAEKLGREPSHNEACGEVRRILQEAMVEDAESGRLPHQRGRI